jgi:hypothetical protein
VAGNDEHNPAGDLGNIFLQRTDSDADDVCPGCKEELGILNLLGLRK